MTIDIVDLPCKHVDFPWFFVGLPETKWRQDEDFTAFYGLPHGPGTKFGMISDFPWIKFSGYILWPYPHELMVGLYPLGFF